MDMTRAGVELCNDIQAEESTSWSSMYYAEHQKAGHVFCWDGPEEPS
jgi:hypothetical protein